MSDEVQNHQEQPKKKSARRKPLAKKTWATIAGLWAIGDVTLKELSQRFNVAPETISRKMKAMGVRQGERAEEHAKDVKAAVEKASADDAAVIADRIRETKEEHYKNSQAISKLSMAIVAKARQENRSLATTEPELKALERLAKIQDSSLKQRWTILGLDKDDVDEGDLPELTIRELTDSEIGDVQREAEQAAAGVGAVDLLGDDMSLDVGDFGLESEDG